MDIAATLGQPVVRAKDARAGGRLLGDYARDFSVWTPATSTLWRVWGRVTNTLRNGRQDGLSWVLWLSRCLEGRGVKHGFR